MHRRHAILAVLAALAVAAAQVVIRSQSVSPVTTPQQQMGANVGDDYFLATYTQLERYWQTLDRESDRLALVDIGRTEEGRTQWMAVVTAPENHARLERYRDIARRLARAEGLTEAQARSLAEEGKAIVWIDGGLHADEVLGSQQLIELVYQLVSRSDAETLRILRDVIVLVGHANPDGHELVASWYMRESDPVRRRLSGLPRAYQKYVGHDNNRDFYLSSQAETTNINRVLYKEWFPQIVFDHHQAGPPGTVMFAPPFRDPFNYVFDPIMPASIDLIGAAMHARFAEEGKPGVTMRGGSTYSTWWNGGLRTTAYFHNQIGLLTETIGDPAPISIPFVADRQVPSNDLPFPIPPQRWRFRQSIDYSMTANRAVLDAASRYRETLLLNVFRMGRNAIERGQRDTWTLSPKRLGPDGRGRRDPRLRDARAYVLPSDQPDFLTATKFVDALLKTGVTVHRASRDFRAAGKAYPAGSYVVLTAQAFRPHILDMFEPQDHPDDVPYPGATPVPPYDIAGWTLAFQMGVKFDRVVEAVDGPFDLVSAVAVPQGRLVGAAGAAGFLFSHHQNDAFIAVNRLLKTGAQVYWLTDRAAGGAPSGTGMMYVEAADASADARGRLETALGALAAQKGLIFTGVRDRPASATLRLRPVRIGLWDQYGGSSPSGWTRWLLEQYEFPFETVYAPAIDAGALADRFDVLILPDDAVPGSGAASSVSGGEDARSRGVPPEYRERLGRLTWDRSAPRLEAFAERGGTLIAIGDATALGEHLGIVRSALVDAPGGTPRPLTREEHYVPGAVLRVAVDNRAPLGYGFEDAVDVFFDDSPAFRLQADAAARGARRVAWYADATPLRSGWALGQRYLEGGLAVVDAPIGHGRLFLFGPEITFRGQPHGTFKFLFNAIYAGHLGESAGALTAPEMRRQDPQGFVVAYEGARLIPGDGRPPIERAVLLVDGGRIRQVGRMGEIRVPAGTARVDLAGKTILPTLVNAHTHTGFQRGASYARDNYTREQVLQDLERAQYFGVAAVLSQGIDLGEVGFELRADQAAGRAGGARLRLAGRGIGAPNAGPGAAAYQGIAYEVTTPDDGRRAVAELAAHKVDIVKIWVDDRNGRAPRLAEPVYRAIIDDAHRRGLRVNAHVFYLEDLKSLVEAGVDGLAHLARDLELDDAAVAAIVKRRVYVMPTLATPERATHTSVPPPLTAWLDGPDGTALGAPLVERIKAAFGGRSTEAAGEARQRYGILERSVARLAKAGANLLLGSDTGIQDHPFGFTDHRELEMMTAAGVSPMQVLVAATSRSAEYLRLGDLGTLAPGKSASFIVLDANPLDDIANTRRIAEVYIDGRRLDRQALRVRLSGSP